MIQGNKNNNFIIASRAYFIKIVVIHIFIILMPKEAKLIMIVQLICGTAVWVISV